MQEGTTILLVDDNEDDALFFKRALARNGFPYRLHVAQNGLEAKNYINGDGEYADREKFPFPKFIVTDNRMPVMTGKELLVWLREHPKFSVVPTIVFGGSSNPDEIDEAYQKLGAHSVIIKPSDHHKLEDVVKKMFDYWSICEVPRCKI